MNALRKVQFDEVARAKRIYRGGDLGQVKLNHRPACGRQNQNSEASVTHRVTQGSGRSLVKENLHRCRRCRLAASGGSQTLFGMMQNGLNMFAGHAREPFQEIIHPRPIFQVLEERLDRHPGALEDPGAADLPRRPFDYRTVTPIKHRGILAGYRTFSTSSRGHARTSFSASSRFALAPESFTLRNGGGNSRMPHHAALGKPPRGPSECCTIHQSITPMLPEFARRRLNQTAPRTEHRKETDRTK